jgi:hypothetical protein
MLTRNQKTVTGQTWMASALPDRETSLIEGTLLIEHTFGFSRTVLSRGNRLPFISNRACMGPHVGPFGVTVENHLPQLAGF